MQTRFCLPSDYAARAGISKQAISKAILSGRIPVYDLGGNRLAPDAPGKKFVDSVEADRIRGTSLRVDSASMPAQTRPAADELPEQESASATLVSARSDVARIDAQLKGLELATRRGELVDKRAVEAAITTAGRRIAQDLNGLLSDVEEIVAVGIQSGVPAARAVFKTKLDAVRSRIADRLSAPYDQEEGGSGPS